MSTGDPGPSYLARLEWTPRGDAVAIERLSRDQKRLDLLRCARRRRRLRHPADRELAHLDQSRPRLPVPPRRPLPLGLRAERLAAPLPLRRRRPAGAPGDPRRLGDHLARRRGGATAPGRSSPAIPTGRPRPHRPQGGARAPRRSGHRADQRLGGADAGARLAPGPGLAAHRLLGPHLERRQHAAARRGAVRGRRGRPAPLRAAQARRGVAARSGSSSPSPGRTARACPRACSSRRASTPRAAIPVIIYHYGGPGSQVVDNSWSARRALAQADGGARLRRVQRRQPVLPLLRQGGRGPRLPPLRHRQPRRPARRGRLPEEPALGGRLPPRPLGVVGRRLQHALLRPQPAGRLEGRHRRRPGDRLEALRLDLDRALPRPPAGQPGRLPRLRPPDLRRQPQGPPADRPRPGGRQRPPAEHGPDERRLDQGRPPLRAGLLPRAEARLPPAGDAALLRAGGGVLRARADGVGAGRSQGRNDAPPHRPP